jgi:hypothetical protein
VVDSEGLESRKLPTRPRVKDAQCKKGFHISRRKDSTHCVNKLCCKLDLRTISSVSSYKFIIEDCYLSQVKVTLRLTVSQSVSLGVEPHMGLMVRYLLLFDSYGVIFVGRPL